MKNARQAQATTVKSVGPAQGYLFSGSAFMFFLVQKSLDNLFLDVDPIHFHPYFPNP